MTTVVNASNDTFDVYCGTMFAARADSHYGNPFSHHKHSSITNLVGSPEEALASYEAWLLEEAYQEIEPVRRAWILEHLPELKGKILGVPLGFGKPYHPNHAEILAHYADLL